MSKRMSLISACIVVGWLARGTPSAAQIYTWTDASGTIHFSDTPPPRTRGNSAVEVLPEIQHRPSTATRRPVEDQPEPPEPAMAPADHNDTDDDYATEPEEGVDSDAIIEDDGARDPAVWYRANSPRNRPGQPIQPARRRR